MKKEMRRNDKQVQDKSWIEDVLKRGKYLYLGLATPDGDPYVVPLGYAYEDGTIYLHGAANGLKTDIIESNARASFNVTLDIELVRDEKGSEFTNKYRSVTGFGDVSAITALDEKNAALAILMRNFGGPHSDVTEEMSKSVWVAKI